MAIRDVRGVLTNVATHYRRSAGTDYQVVLTQIKTLNSPGIKGQQMTMQPGREWKRIKDAGTHSPGPQQRRQHLRVDKQAVYVRFGIGAGKNFNDFLRSA